MNCTGLALEWDQCGELRDRLRQGQDLFIHPKKVGICLANRQNAVENACVLRPVLQRLSESPNYKLPAQDDLKREVHMLFDKVGLTTKGKEDVAKNAIEIKRMCGFIKRRAHRGEVTKDAPGANMTYSLNSELLHAEIMAPHYSLQFVVRSRAGS